MWTTRKWSKSICFLLISLLNAVVLGRVSVYIHAGQSNMEGHGSIRHLKLLLQDPGNIFYYWNLVDWRTGEWRTLDNVYCRYNDFERRGKLTVGYGFRTHKFGPELGFGFDMSHRTNNTVLIIKAVFGGASLAGDFRPPSSGPPSKNYTLYDYNGESDDTLVPGHRFRHMVQLVNETLSNIKETVTDYDGSGISIDGFVWFQGFSDAIDPDKAEEYETNLQNLMRDTREILNLGNNVPFVIGELGMQGAHPDPRHEFIREIQRNVSNYTEFQNNTLFVPTAVLVPDDPSDFDEDGAGSFHYHGRADTIYHIGKSFAHAIRNFEGQNDTEDDDTSFWY